MQHLAMIMDGNRRWAKENKLAAVTLGHRKGVDTIGVAIKFCLQRHIPYLSLYACSIENLKRSETEKNYLFDLLVEGLHKNLDAFVRDEIKIRFVGDRNFFPERIRAAIDEAEDKTKHLNKLHLNFLFCYGSKQEMVSATQRIAQKVKNGELDSNDVNESTLKREMWLGEIPDPDLIVRTGGYSRLSNFLLFQAAYSELMFLDCYWPEIDEQKLQSCVDQFYKIQKNVGE